MNKAAGSAAGKAENAGITTVASLVSNPSGDAASNGGSPGEPGSPQRGFRIEFPPSSRGTTSGGNPGLPGSSIGTDGLPDLVLAPCAPQLLCPNTRIGLIVPGNTVSGIVPLTPAGPWVPTGPATRLDPVAEAHNLVNHKAWPTITIGINPNPGVVAVPSWFWLQNYSGQTLTNSGTISETHQECRSVTVAGADPGDPPTTGLECHDVTNTMVVEARAGPTNYQWTFGDGRAGSQEEYPNPTGLGRAYTDPYTPSPVAWSYEFSSYGHPSGFHIEVQITFASEFRANGGAWSTLADVTRTYTGSHVVEQVLPLRVVSTSAP